MLRAYLAAVLLMLPACDRHQEPPAARESSAAEFYRPVATAPAGLDPNAFYPNGRRLAFMGYSGDPQRDLARGFTVAGPVYGDQMPYLKKCFENGWPVVAHIGPKITFNDKSPDKYRLDESSLRETIIQQVRELAPHPEIIWWAVHPEELRQWRKDEMRYLEIVTATIREVDPQKRPVYLYNPNHRDAAALTPIAAHVDVVGKGCYVNLAGKKRERSWVRWSIEQETAAIRAAQSPGAIPLLLPELCQDPAPEEEHEIRAWVRHDIYLGMASGARAVNIWSLFKRPAVRKTWQIWYDAYSECAMELNGQRALAQVFLFGEPRHDLTIDQASGKGSGGIELGGDMEPETSSAGESAKRTIETSTWTSLELAHGASRYLFLINSANEAATFTIRGWPHGSAAENAFDGSPVPVPAGPLKLELPAYGVAGYRFHQGP